MKKLTLFLTLCALMLSVNVAQADEWRGQTNPSNGCYQSGTLLEKIDFGRKNSPSDPNVKSFPPTIHCEYTYMQSLDNAGAVAETGVYALCTQNPNPHPNTWYTLSDHTEPGTGYFFACDAATRPGLVYELDIRNLCQGSTLTFSAWLVSLCKTQHDSKANMTFTIKDLNTDVTLATFNTGNLPDAEGIWKNYGFSFISEGEDIKLILNAAAGGAGNDFGVDDIEVRLCAPSIEFQSAEQSVCVGEDITFPYHYQNDGSLAEPVAYQWYYSATGDIPSQTDWTGWIEFGPQREAVNGGDVDLVLTNVSAANEGYYRLAVAGNGVSIRNQDKCQVRSPEKIHLIVKDSANLSLVGNVENICKDVQSQFVVEFAFAENTITSVNYTLQFSDAGIAARNSTTGTLQASNPTLTVNLPTDVQTGNYEVIINFDSNAQLCAGSSLTVPFTVIDCHCDTLIEQNWDDVIAVLNGSHGGYDKPQIASIQWYRNDYLLAGETGFYIYVQEKLNPTDTYFVKILLTDGREITSCKLEVAPYNEAAGAVPQVAVISPAPNRLPQIYSSQSGLLKIYNIAGILIGEQQISENMNDITVQLATGMYIMQAILNDGYTKSFKISIK
jgi:hypothetical protein